MNDEPKFWPIDALNAYPEPVGTLDRLELSGGAVWVLLNGKRAKLVGLQSLAFLIGNLQAIHDEVFASAEPSVPECATCDGDKLVVIGFNSDAGENIEGPCPDCAPSAPVERDEVGELDRLRSALKFYADREHFHFESGNWDTVSGEPLNILWCGDEPDFIEDGTVARAALERQP